MTKISALRFALATAVAGAAAAGCVRGTGQNAGPAPAMMQGGSSTTCALAQLNNVDATVTDVHNGVAITFAAPQGEREKLREAVRDMATPRAGAVVDVFSGCACPSPGPGRSAATGTPAPTTDHARPAGGTASMQATPLIMPAVTKETDTASGAVLVLRGRTDQEGAALTTAVHEKLAAMHEGCH